MNYSHLVKPEVFENVTEVQRKILEIVLQLDLEFRTKDGRAFDFEPEDLIKILPYGEDEIREAFNGLMERKIFVKPITA